MSFKMFIKCLTSPHLKKIYSQNQQVQISYQPNSFEKWGDSIISSLKFIWKFSLYTSPFLIGILYKKGYYLSDNIALLTKILTTLSVTLAVSFCLRSLGRMQHPAYVNFLEALTIYSSTLRPSDKRNLMKYDFDFEYWPVEFSWNDVQSDKGSHRTFVTPQKGTASNLQKLVGLPFDLIGYISITTFGIRMIYPGYIGIIQKILDYNLLQGRSQLVETHNGQRFKLKSRDNNSVDVMFVDKRQRTDNGSVLFICTEGNAGYYEIGIMCTPLECGYSVLGWNHPGFGGSTGQPYPSQEQNAIDVVLQFAIHKLGFAPENIILFGWSIGGYASSWAAMNYPEIKGVILDATFDDIIPLALNQMPKWMGSLVIDVIRNYANLNIAEQLCRYPGPIVLIRRTEDEILCTQEGDLSSNRGNNLLIKLLKYRYPLIFQQDQINLLKQYLTSVNKKEELYTKYNVNNDECVALLQSYAIQESKSYPMLIGDELSSQDKSKMVLFLAKEYLRDYKSTHCTPLPAEYLQLPFDVNIESEYVFT